MRISSYAVARPAYYDRNATSYLGSYDQYAVAPHTETQRYLTTVASGKKLIVEIASAKAQRVTAATTAGDVVIKNMVQSGSSYVYVTPMVLQSNAANAQVSMVTTGGITLYAGEIAYGSTIDGSTGGTVSYALSIKGTLYDA